MCAKISHENNDRMRNPWQVHHRAPKHHSAQEAILHAIQVGISNDRSDWVQKYCSSRNVTVYPKDCGDTKHTRISQTQQNRQHDLM
jgi:hypothetical protein